MRDISRGFSLRRPPGFTLLELVIVLMALVILLLVAVPSMQGWQENQRMKAAISSLYQDLSNARSQAIMMGEQIAVCPGASTTGCAENSVWDRGWLVYRDVDKDGIYSPTEPVIRVSGEIENIMITSASARPNFVFQPNGTAPGSNGSIWFCDARGPKHAQRLVVSNLGRIRQEKSASIGLDHCPEA